MTAYFDSFDWNEGPVPHALKKTLKTGPPVKWASIEWEKSKKAQTKPCCALLQK